MPSAALHNLKKEEIPKAVECLKDAFKDDPLWAEVFKNDPKKDQSLTSFFTCPIIYGLKYGKVYAVSPEIEGVAVLLPDKYADMSIWRMLLSGAIFTGARISKESVRNLSVVSKPLIIDRKRWMKDKAHSYLMIIGISTANQGKGFGSLMLEQLQKESAAFGRYIYLETEKEENIAFYEKHGFTLLQQIRLKKLNLPMWQMVWKPERAH